MCVVAVHQHFKKLERIYCLFYSYTHVRCFLVVCYQFTAFLHKCIANRVWPPERGKKRKRNDHWKWRNVLHRTICPVYLLLSLVWRSISEICWNSIAVWSLWCGSPDRWWRQEVTIPPQSRRQLWDVERLTGKEILSPASLQQDRVITNPPWQTAHLTDCLPAVRLAAYLHRRRGGGRPERGININRKSGRPL